jgi:hypothetical protein
MFYLYTALADNSSLVDTDPRETTVIELSRKYMEYNLLNLGTETSLIKAVTVSKWGANVKIACLYDPLGTRQPYEMVFQDCQELQWNIIEQANVDEPTADLIGFIRGEEYYRKPAVITTDTFELSISYKIFVLQKNW